MPESIDTIAHEETSPLSPLPRKSMRAGVHFNRDDLLQTVWLIRSEELRTLINNDRDLFEVWCLIIGQRHFRGLAECSASTPQEWLFKPASIASAHTQPPLTCLMHGIWRLRLDLQDCYDISDPAQQQAFVWWYFIHGVAELDLFPLVTPAERRWLNSPDPDAAQGGLLPITRLIHQVWKLRTDLHDSLNPETPSGAKALFDWYFHRGLIDHSLAGYLDDNQMRVLMASSPRATGVPCILKLLYDAEPDLRRQFPDPHSASFRQWASSSEGQERFPVLQRLMAMVGWNAASGNNPVIGRPTHSGSRVKRPFGVNLIGPAKAHLGIGEDVRMAVLACKAAGIPFSVFNVAPGPEVEQDDQSATPYLADDLPYAVNLFCTTGIETARLAAVEGSKLFDGRPSIGYWPWELPEWPADWRHAYNLVDEVWASSRFTYQAFALSCPKLVRHMPMAVSVDKSAGLNRGDFRLPEDRFLFLFSFDLLSSLARKNPRACIDAFSQAFPRGTEPVGLVIKAIRASNDNPLWQEVLAEAKADTRIHIMPANLARGEMFDLCRACDCYISLHRSEGFGRGMAEAMMLGKPVIATGYSGNMDFTLPGTAGLVDHRLCRVQTGDYPFGEGLTWAEPDVENAAWWMSRFTVDEPTRVALARTGQRLVADTYSPSAVGARYRLMLQRIEADIQAHRMAFGKTQHTLNPA